MKITCGKCGEMLDLTRIFKYRYCKECHAENMRMNRRRHSELSPEQRKKANARTYANNQVAKGKIKKQPCGNCGSNESEMHHEDYNKPLDVTWLCRPCHLDLHSVSRETFQ